MVELGVEGVGPGLRVGSGGFGTVFRAEQVGFGRTVAVKILDTVVEQDVELRRFERERTALGSVADHPNIVSVFGWGLTAARRPYLIMEYLPGGTLAGLIKLGPVPPEVAVSVTVKLARALAVAHRRGVLHRDVKPENVLISAFGEPVLCDFGIARPAEGGTTHTSSVAASVMYAAPEVLEGAPPSEAGDVWGLVATLHTMLAGRPPFSGAGGSDSTAAVVTRVLTQPPPDLRSVGVSGDVASVVDAGLAKDPTKRLATAAEVAERLEAVMAVHGWSHQLLPVAQAEPEGTSRSEAALSQRGTEVLTASRDAGRVDANEPTHAGRGRGPVLVAVGLALALVFAGLAAALTRGGGGSPASGEVFLEAKGSDGAEPFMPSVAPSPVSSVPAAQGAFVAGPGAGVKAALGDAPGLYGGTQKQGSCDRSKIVEFLRGSPEKAKAWVSALNTDPMLRWSRGTSVGIDQIGSYIGELTPMLLRADTRITNHGFLNGAVTSRQSVLQDGTAVLVDKLGTPRVRCACGNPLTPPRPVTTGLAYNGERWTGFDPAALLRVEQAAGPIETFDLIDLPTGEPFRRPSGTNGDTDIPLQKPPEPTTTTSPTPTTTTTTPPTTTTRPQSPADLVSKAMDRNFSHWRKSAQPDETYPLRVFDKAWQLVKDFPVNMNGCSTGQTRVSWRSLEGAVRSGITDFKDSFDNTPVIPTVTAPANTKGTMVFNNCEQPAFANNSGSNQNIVLDVTFYQPAAG